MNKGNIIDSKRHDQIIKLLYSFKQWKIKLKAKKLKRTLLVCWTHVPLELRSVMRTSSSIFFNLKWTLENPAQDPRGRLVWSIAKVWTSGFWLTSSDLRTSLNSSWKSKITFALLFFRPHLVNFLFVRGDYGVHTSILCVPVLIFTIIFFMKY